MLLLGVFLKLGRIELNLADFLVTGHTAIQVLQVLVHDGFEVFLLVQSKGIQSFVICID